jgi:hypothetical protein
MKTALLILPLIAIAFVVFQGFTASSVGEIETQPYEIIRSESEIEIRAYPSVITASYLMKTIGYKNSAGKGFRTLANYIFGENNTNSKIAMTAPVHMEMTDSTTRMHFMMPAEYSMEDLPMPSDASIEIGPTKSKVVAVISFGGYANDDRIASKKSELRAWLDQNNMTYMEPFTFLGYNPPYQVFGRRNEVIVEIEL